MLGISDKMSMLIVPVNPMFSSCNPNTLPFFPQIIPVQFSLSRLHGSTSGFQSDSGFGFPSEFLNAIRLVMSVVSDNTVVKRKNASNSHFFEAMVAGG